MFTVVKDHNGPATPGPRTRKLERWTLRRDSDGTPYLTGITVEDAGQPITTFMRVTSTSHIVSVNGRVATTTSGSQYTLLSPAVGQVDVEDSRFKL